MQQHRNVSRRRIVLKAVLAMGAIAQFSGYSNDVNAQQTTPKETKSAATPEAQVRAAIQDALKRLDAGDIQGFMEYYMPADELRRMRQSKMLARMADLIKSQPQQIETTRERFSKGLKSTSWEFDETQSIVKIDLTKTGDKPEAPKLPEYVEPATTKVAITGYGSDLKVVLNKAIAAIQAGNAEEYVTKMFPIGALREPGFEKKQPVIVAMYKSNPKLTESLLADLKTMQSLTPKMVNNGATAEYVIPGAEFPVRPPNGPATAPDRTVKLQKVEGHWRLFDNTTPARKTIAQQQTQPLPEIKGATDQNFLILEKLGDGWRIMPYQPK